MLRRIRPLYRPICHRPCFVRLLVGLFTNNYWKQELCIGASERDFPHLVIVAGQVGYEHEKMIELV